MPENNFVEHVMEREPERQDEVISDIRPTGDDIENAGGYSAGQQQNIGAYSGGVQHNEQRQQPSFASQPTLSQTAGGDTATAESEPQWQTQNTGRVHIVETNETLRTIAEHELGNPELWQSIYDLNTDRLSSADHLYPGQEIILPA